MAKPEVVITAEQCYSLMNPLIVRSDFGASSVIHSKNSKPECVTATRLLLWGNLLQSRIEI